ncbi:MAG: TolC family protein [Bacteroidales bacterium]|nr:TolC family protein [Bacteroidales bacterium]
MTNKIKIFFLGSLLLLSACSLYKPYEEVPSVPADIMGEIVQPDDTTSLGALSWRELFTDPLLQQLIERALQNNTDVQQAQLTIEQAQNDLASARLGYFPTLSFEPSGSLTRFNSETIRSYVIPLTASWQTNIFGQVASQKRKAKAYQQMQEDYKQAVQAQLAANVAATYYHLVMLDRELQILQETQEVWEKSLESMRVLYEAGLYQSPAVHQMEASLASVLGGIAEVQSLLQITESSLCLLLSETPHHIDRSPYGSFVMPAQLNVGVPLHLLDARPDVRQAARGIEIAYYDTQQAHQALYPNLTLSATLGWSNGEGLVNPARFLSQAVASLTQPLFAQGRLRARYKNAQIEQEKARLHFVQTLLNAGNEVYCQLSICKKTEQKAAYLTSIVHSLNEAYIGTSELMNNGTNTYVEVLKSQEDLLTAQITEVQNHYEGIQAVINLYTALGGFGNKTE